MVFYFSGTGNSRFVARMIAKAVGQEPADITAYTKTPQRPVFTEPGVYVFVCPSYMSAPARAMTDFIDRAEFPSGVKAYFIVTCAASMGITPRVASDLCEKKGLKFMGAAQIEMPQNYIALFTTKKVEEWVRDLYYKHFMKTTKFHATDKCISCGACVNICPFSNITMKDGRPSWSNNCTHCMACINRCPQDAIEYGKGSAGKPRYKGPEACMKDKTE